MLAIVHSFGIIGINAYPVEIEVDVSNGLPSITIVGLPDSSIKESKERVRSGIRNSGFTYPYDKVTVNLAPADVKKEGSAFDLAIAMGILAASKQISADVLNEYYFVGELSLNGEIRSVKGALAMALTMRHKKIKKIILPETAALEAAIIKDIQAFGVKTLRELIPALYEPQLLKSTVADVDHFRKIASVQELDLGDVKGQNAAKRALEIAASGQHNILLVGPPGSGKTMLAKRLTTILPDLTDEEALEVTQIHSTSGILDTKNAFIFQRPFRTPHHTISDVALVGGGTIPQPGEISLAHNGILFMDELPEFHRDVLEVLRQPLEDGSIRISRASKSLVFPARFMLVAAMNPCPCGSFGQSQQVCRCSPHQVFRYRSRISGPLLDRIDIHMEIPAIKYQELVSTQPQESSRTIKERVTAAHKIQQERFQGQDILFNAVMSHKHIKKYCSLDKEASALLKQAMEKFHLSMRAYDKILKVGRTIADLEEKERIAPAHIAEAIQYRSLDRNFFM